MFMTKTGAAAFACRRGSDAAVRLMAGRGRHRIFKSHPAVYGVCGHWIRKRKAFSPCPLPGLYTSRGYPADQSPPTQFCKRSAVSGRRKIRLRAGAELLFLPGRGRCLSGGEHSRRWWALPSSAFPTTLPASSSSLGCCWGGSSAVSSAHSGGFRSFCTRSHPQSFPPKAEAAALFKVCGAAGHGGVAAFAGGQ